MTRLQEIRDRIALCQKKLRDLKSSEENLKNIVELGIADLMMRKWAEHKIPAVQREFESVHIALLNAEAEEHRLTWPRMQRRSGRR